MVSYRRSLYRQSGRSSSVQAYKNEIDEHVSHWSRVWITPLVNAPGGPHDATNKSNGHQSNNDALKGSYINAVPSIDAPNSGTPGSTNSNDPNDAAKSAVIPKIKMWAMLANPNDYVPVTDGDETDHLDLVAATAAHKAKYAVTLPEDVQNKADQKKKDGKDGSLTAADIRGAVGGGDAGTNIAGYSVADSGKKNEETVKEPPKDTTVSKDTLTSTDPKDSTTTIAENLPTQSKESESTEPPSAALPVEKKEDSNILPTTSTSTADKPVDKTEEPSTVVVAEKEIVDDTAPPADSKSPKPASPSVEATSAPSPPTTATEPENIEVKEKEDKDGDVEMEDASTPQAVVGSKPDESTTAENPESVENSAEPTTKPFDESTQTTDSVTDNTKTDTVTKDEDTETPASPTKSKDEDTNMEDVSEEKQ